MLRLLRLVVVLAASSHDGNEPTDRLVPPGFVGNPWGPAATRARESGELPPVAVTPQMAQWDEWGRKVLRDGDLLFRRGDAKVLFGYFPFSRFLANVTNSRYSHVGTVVIEDGNPVVYDTTKAGVRRQPLSVWVLDNVGGIGVKRLKPAYRDRIPGVVGWLHQTFESQVPFDYSLGLDDSALYCVEMAEKAFRSQGLPLSEPVKLGDMERATHFPIAIFLFQYLSVWSLPEPLTLEQRVYFPGNERHGIWSSPLLETVYVQPERNQAGQTAQNAGQKSDAARQKSGADTKAGAGGGR